MGCTFVPFFGKFFYLLGLNPIMKPLAVLEFYEMYIILFVFQCIYL